MGAGCGCGVKHGWWIGWKDVEEEEKKRRKKKGGGDHVHSAEYIQSTEYIVQSTEYRNKEISDWIETDRIGSDGKVQAQVLASANGRNRFEPGPDDGRVLAKIQREEILDGFVRSFFFSFFRFFFFRFSLIVRFASESKTASKTASGKGKGKGTEIEIEMEQRQS